HGVVVAADDDLATAPGAARNELARGVAVPLRRPAGGGRVFIDERHDACAGGGLTAGHGPVVFTGHERLIEGGRLADVAVGHEAAGLGAEHALVLNDVLGEEDAEGVVGGDGNAAGQRILVGIRVDRVVVLREDLHGHDDLTAVV